MNLRGKFVALFGLAMIGLSHQSASANSVTFSGSAGNGGSADVTFTTGHNSLEIDLTNTGTYSGSFNQTQAISGLIFSLTGYTPSAFNELDGREISISNAYSWIGSTGATFTDTSVGTTKHNWDFSAGSLSALGSATPSDMILPGTGTWPSNNGGQNFNPYLAGTTKFLLTVSGLETSTNLSLDSFGVLTVTFGTAPDDSVTLTPPGGTPPTVPLPAAVWSGGALIAGLAAVRRIKRKSA